MKKVLCILLVLVMALGLFAGCGQKADTTKEIVMITDVGDVDDQSFNQGTWEGVKAWAEKNGKTYDYIKPATSGEADLLVAIDLAVTNGAKVIVTPGFAFGTAVYKAQDTYPDVKFIILDSTANNGDFTAWNEKHNSNVASFTYAAEYSGFLAGYAAVKEGMTKLAYLGGVGYSTVYCFGVGFCQGADYAAKELGIANINIQYGYTGDFFDTPANKTKATAIFSSGVECLFSVGGANQKSCFSAASESKGKWVMTPDTDGTGLSETCLTSALKELALSVNVALDDIYKTNSSTYFGKVTVGTVQNKMVGLANNFTRFTKFTKADYDAIYAKLVSGEVKVLMPTEDFSKTAGTGSITMSNVTIEYID